MSGFSFSKLGENKLKYVSPIIDCEIDQEEVVLPYSTKKIIKDIEDLSKKNDISNYALYFRDLNNGPWIGIHEKEYFSAASLLKLPIFISYLKIAESEPAIMNKKIKFNTENIKNKDMAQMIKPSKQIENNKEYSIGEMLDYMIINSDNYSAEILAKNLNQDYLLDTFKKVLVDINITEQDDLVRVKDYAGFFRVLYNSTYLSPKISNFALERLASVEFSEGINKGLPDDVEVAHKFGERTTVNQTTGETEKQLHDCGIVYYPKSPYIMCIMSKGSSFDDLVKFISDSSQYFYNMVSSN